MKRISVVIPALRETPREGDTNSRILERCILWFILLLSIALRVSLYKMQNGDYSHNVRPWYDYIQAHGGFAALKDTFSDSNPAYLYLLALATYLPLEPIVAIKGISILFDPLLALFTYLILRLKYTHSSVPIIGAVVILFAPTVFINSAAWGQYDGIYTTWCLGSLYFLLSKRPAWACVFFGMALSFNWQAIFFLPVLIVLLLTRKLAITSLILIPVIYLALLMPALLAGRDLWSLLTIYLGQANQYSWALTLNAPTFYQWVPAKEPQDWIRMGIILATMMVALISFLTVRSRKPITPDIILKLTLVFALAIPFFLPEMHERYFYMADVVSIVYAFCFPRYWYVALIEQLCSSMSCIPSLFSEDPTINLAYVALAVLFLIAVVLADLVKTLFPTIHVSATMPVASSDDLSLADEEHFFRLEQRNAQETEEHRLSSKKTRFLQHGLVLYFLAGLLLYGAFTDHGNDPLGYQCYAIAFWHGWSGFQMSPWHSWSGFQMSPELSDQCGFIQDLGQDLGQDLATISQNGLLHALQQWRLPSGLVQFVAAQSPRLSYHALPYEYPLLTILPFSLGLLTPPDWYRVTFGLSMVFIAGATYVVLLFRRSRRAALAYALYVVIGGWMMVAGRFDIVPAALTLFAVICAGQKRWNCAFALLAVATLSKFYPILLVIPFILDIQKKTPGKWYARHKWLPVGGFAGIGILVLGGSLLLSVAGTLTPLGFFIARPVQHESFSASLLWIANLLGKTPLTYVGGFGSSNVASPLSPIVTLLMNMMLLVGLCSTWWLQRRGRIDLAMACLLTLLIVLVTAKVFSLQYIIWIIPLAAYVGQSNRWWLLFWTLVGLLGSWRLTVLLTSWIYPSIYSLYTTPLFYAIRNFLLVGFIVSTLISRSVLSHPKNMGNGSLGNDHSH